MLLLHTEQLMELLMDIVRKDESRMKLLTERHSNNANALTTFVQRLEGFPDGIKMFKEKVLASVKSAEEKDIPVWAHLLYASLNHIRKEKDLIETVKYIVEKFDHKQLKIKLLKYWDKNTQFMNVFDVMAKLRVSGCRRLWIYFLKFIDNSVHRKVLLRTDTMDGESPMFRLFSNRRDRDYEAQQILEKFEGQAAELLMAKNDLKKTILENSRSAIIAKNMRYLEEDQLPQFIIDNMDNSKCKAMLFNYVQEQIEIRDNLIQELLFNVKRQSDGASFLMIIMQLSAGKKAYSKWMWPYIMALEAEQIEQLLAQTDDNGDTVLLHCVKSVGSLQIWNDVLALYPDDDAKKQAIKQMNHEGTNSFDSALQSSSRYFKAYNIWNMKTSSGDALLLSSEERLQLLSVDNLSDANWKKRTKEVMKEIDKVNDVKLLVSLWSSATSNGDDDFAKMILKKLDDSNRNAVTQFLTTKPERGEYSVWHMAASTPHDRIVMMELLFSLADRAEVDVGDILMDPELSSNEYETTPLMYAVECNNLKIATLILSRFSDKKEKQKLLLMSQRVNTTVNHTNYFDRKQHEIKRNVVVEALRALSGQSDYLRESTRMPMVKLLVESCDKFKAVLKYKNSKMESIYHYLITQDLCEYFKSMKVTFNVESWSITDVNGVTPFMKALQVSGDRSKIEFVKWIFANCCNNTEEKLSLIYQYDNTGRMAFQYAGGTLEHYLINFVKSKCNYKSIEVYIALIHTFQPTFVSLSNRYLYLLVASV